MATDINLLMGEVVSDPLQEKKDIEKLLNGFLQSLLEEQCIKSIGQEKLKDHE